MRTTIDLDPSVLRELRKRGHREGKSMGRLASELLASALDAPAGSRPPAFAWTTGKLGGPLVDLENPEVVRRALEEPS